MYFENDRRLKILHGITKLIGIVPHYKSKTDTKSTAIYRCYSVIVIIFHFVCYMVTIYTKYFTNIFARNVSSVAIGFISCTLFELLTIDPIIRWSFFNTSDFEKLASNLDDVDSYLKVNKSDKEKYLWFWLQLLGLHVGLSIFIIQDFNLWKDILGVKLAIVSHTIDYLQAYNYLITIWLMYEYLLVITRQYKMLNTILNHYRLNKTDVRKLSRAYYQMSRIIRAYNDIFGWRLFYSFGAVLLFMLDGTNFITDRFFSRHRINDDDLRNRTVYIFILWAVVVLVSI